MMIRANRASLRPKIPTRSESTSHCLSPVVLHAVRYPVHWRETKERAEADRRAGINPIALRSPRAAELNAGIRGDVDKRTGRSFVRAYAKFVDRSPVDRNAALARA